MHTPLISQVVSLHLKGQLHTGGLILNKIVKKSIKEKLCIDNFLLINILENN